MIEHKKMVYEQLWIHLKNKRLIVLPEKDVVKVADSEGSLRN